MKTKCADCGWIDTTAWGLDKCPDCKSDKIRQLGKERCQKEA